MYRAMKTYGGVELQLYVFLTSARNGGEDISGDNVKFIDSFSGCWSKIEIVPVFFITVFIPVATPLTGTVL
jgi:hypothetical protein